MKLREKIADWISGGALSRDREIARRWKQQYLYARADYVSSCSQSDIGWYVARKAHETLRAIAALETPNMAHVGKKAVKLAKEGLGNE